MGALTASVLGLAMLSPVLAPVPAAPKPDPFAKGYLGIYFSGSGPNSTLVIERLEPNQPAAAAGIRPGDVIVRVNELQPRLVQQVIDHVCTFRPGAVIEVEVQRGAARKAFKIKLGTRPPDAGYVPLPRGRFDRD
ncbi:MAG TPA: PDZ domain-containing protein [Urbifossiella sp.]|nr:PDZ domain-containing protein [Urbifossiella sp.]